MNQKIKTIQTNKIREMVVVEATRLTKLTNTYNLKFKVLFIAKLFQMNRLKHEYEEDSA